MFIDIEATIKPKLGSMLKELNQRQSWGELADFDYCDNEACTSTQFLEIQEKQLIDLRSIWNIFASFQLSVLSAAQIMIST